MSDKRLVSHCTEVSTTEGALDYVLLPLDGWQRFQDQLIDQQEVYYYAVGNSSEWEAGLGVFEAATNKLLRPATVLAGSNGTNPVSWAAGLKRIVGAIPAPILLELISPDRQGVSDQGLQVRIDNFGMAKVELMPGSFISVVNGDGTGAGDITIDETQVLARGAVADVYRTLSDYLTIGADTTYINKFATGTSKHTINGPTKYIEPAVALKRLGISDYKLHLTKPGTSAAFDSGNIDSSLGDSAQTYFSQTAQRMEGQIIDTAKNYSLGAVNGYFLKITSGPGSAQGLKKIVASFGQKITVIDGWSDPQPGEGTISQYEIVDVKTRRVHDFAHMGAGSGIDVDLIKSLDYSANTLKDGTHKIYLKQVNNEDSPIHEFNFKMSGIMSLPGDNFVIQYGTCGYFDQIAFPLTRSIYLYRPIDIRNSVFVMPITDMSYTPVANNVPFALIEDYIKTDNALIDGFKVKLTDWVDENSGSAATFNIGFLAISPKSSLYQLQLLHSFESATGWTKTGPAPAVSELPNPYTIEKSEISWAQAEGNASMAFPYEIEDWHASSGSSGWVPYGATHGDPPELEMLAVTNFTQLMPDPERNNHIVFPYGLAFWRWKTLLGNEHTGKFGYEYTLSSSVDATGCLLGIVTSGNSQSISSVDLQISWVDGLGRAVTHTYVPGWNIFGFRVTGFHGFDADNPIGTNNIYITMDAGWDKTDISAIRIEQAGTTQQIAEGGQLYAAVVEKFLRIPKSVTFYNPDLGSDQDWRLPAGITDPMRIRFLQKQSGFDPTYHEAILDKITFMYSSTTGQAEPANRYEVVFQNPYNWGTDPSFTSNFDFVYRRFNPTVVGSPDPSAIRHMAIKLEMHQNIQSHFSYGIDYGLKYPYQHPSWISKSAEYPGHNELWNHGNSVLFDELTMLGGIPGTVQIESFDDVVTDGWASGHTNPLSGTGPTVDNSLKFEGVASAKLANYQIDHACDNLDNWTMEPSSASWAGIIPLLGYPADPGGTALNGGFGLKIWGYYTFPSSFNATNCLLAFDLYYYSGAEAWFWFESGGTTGFPGPNGCQYHYQPQNPDPLFAWTTVVIDADSPSDSFGSWDKTDVRRFGCFTWSGYITNIRRINKYVEHYDGSRTSADYTSTTGQPFSIQHYGQSNDLSDGFGVWISSTTGQARPNDRFEWVKTGPHSVGAWSQNQFAMSTYGFPNIANIQSMGVFTQVQSGDQAVLWTKNETGVINFDDLRFDSGS